MKLPRRKFLHLAAGAAALPVMSRTGSAQSYPAQPVRIVVGFAPGGGTDISARLIAQWLSERIGQQFFVENRPGAGANIAMEAVAKAAPDGYTLLMVSPGAAINATLYDKLNYNFIRDIAAIGGVVTVPNVMVVPPSVPATSVPEFIAYVKANAGKINMASGGNGTSEHVSGELFKMMAGVNMVHVPYRGGGLAMTDLLGGQVQVFFGNALTVIEHVKSGKVRALAVTTAKRAEALLPDVPTVGEFVQGYEASNWFGVAAPRNTPAAIINKLNNEINASLADPKLLARFRDLGGTPFPGSPGDFEKHILAETEKWGKVIRAGNVKPE